MRGCGDTRLCKLFLSLVVECKTAQNNTVYLTLFNVFAHFFGQTFSDYTMVPTKHFFLESLLIIEIQKYIIVAKQLSSQRAVLVHATHQQSGLFFKGSPISV